MHDSIHAALPTSAAPEPQQPQQSQQPEPVPAPAPAPAPSAPAPAPALEWGATGGKFGGGGLTWG